MEKHLEKKLSEVSSVLLGIKSGLVLAGSYDSAIRAWELNSGKLVKTLKGHKDLVNCLDIYEPEDTPLLISGSYDHTVKIWENKKKGSGGGLRKMFGKK